MLAWLGSNLATIVVGAVLLLVVAFIIIKLYKDKKEGKHSCGGNCSGCSMCSTCNLTDKDSKKD